MQHDGRAESKLMPVIESASIRWFSDRIAHILRPSLPISPFGGIELSLRWQQSQNEPSGLPRRSFVIHPAHLILGVGGKEKSNTSSPPNWAMIP